MSRFEILEGDDVADYDTLDDAIDALEGGRTTLRWTLAALVGEAVFIASMLLMLVVSVVIGFDRVGWFAATIVGGLGVYGYLFARTRRLLREGRERRDRLAASIDEAIIRGGVPGIETGSPARVPVDLRERTEFGTLDAKQHRAYALVVAVSLGFPALIHFGPSEWDTFNIVLGALVGLTGVASIRHLLRRGPSHRVDRDALSVLGSVLATEIRIPWAAIERVRLSSGLGTTLEIEVHDRRELFRAQRFGGKVELALGWMFGRTISVALPQDVGSREYLALLRNRIRRSHDDEVRTALSHPGRAPDSADSLPSRNAAYHPEEDSGSGK